jgi:hypothetical protein
LTFRAPAAPRRQSTRPDPIPVRLVLGRTPGWRRCTQAKLPRPWHVFRSTTSGYPFSLNSKVIAVGVHISTGMFKPDCSGIEAKGLTDMTTFPPPAHIRQASAVGLDVIKLEWPNIGGRIRRRWRQLTADDVAYPGGNAEYLAGLLQERYSVDRREALLQVSEFESEL